MGFAGPSLRSHRRKTGMTAMVPAAWGSGVQDLRHRQPEFLAYIPVHAAGMGTQQDRENHRVRARRIHETFESHVLQCRH